MEGAEMFWSVNSKGRRWVWLCDRGGLVWFGFPFPTKDKHFKCQPSEAKSLLWGWGQQCWVLR